MPTVRLRASYLLRLNQRLSQLSFDLRDLRTGHAHHFGDARELSSFLEAAALTASDLPDGTPAPSSVKAEPAWNGSTTTPRQSDDSGQRQ